MKWPWKPDVHESLPGRDLRPLVALFPSVAASDVQAALDLIPLATSRTLDNGQLLQPDCFSPEILPITWQGTRLVVPYRVYFPEPAAEALQRLTSRQRQVLHGLYLRHYAGYLRQRRLEALLALSQDSPEALTPPFTFRVVGQYVQEILEVLLASLTPARLTSYVALIQENPLYWQQTQGRVASYWDVYYRRGHRGTPQFRHYVGARLLARLRQALAAANQRPAC
ncbi:MAG: hypothetical protein ACRYF0_15910 [Janthinobacterium lividum]